MVAQELQAATNAQRSVVPLVERLADLKEQFVPIPTLDPAEEVAEHGVVNLFRVLTDEFHYAANLADSRVSVGGCVEVGMGSLCCVERGHRGDLSI